MTNKQKAWKTWGISVLLYTAQSELKTLDWTVRARNEDEAERRVYRQIGWCLGFKVFEVNEQGVET